MPYTQVRRINTIIHDKKKLRKTRPKDLFPTLHQRRYPTTLMNKGFEFAEKVPRKNYSTKKKNHINQKTLAYVENYNKTNPKIFTEKKS